MALISYQRVEAITGDIVEHLKQFDELLYRVTTSEFLNSSKKSKKTKKMLGEIFGLLKLNPKLVLEDKLNKYLGKRNLLVHRFWQTYLEIGSEEKYLAALNFCNDFGEHSERLESFFKGLLYSLASYHVKENSKMIPQLQALKTDYKYFIKSLNQECLS